MKPLTKSIIVALISAIVVALAGGAVWYKQNRTGMLGALCHAGLPNFSRPSSIAADDLGCAILGTRRRMSGIVLTGDEASNLVKSDLPPPPKGGGFTGSTWMTCSEAKGCGRLDKQLQQKISGLCDTGLASVVAYGWATETPGQYGHLGVYAREFFVDEVVAVGPPPPSFITEVRRRWSKASVSDCP